MDLQSLLDFLLWNADVAAKEVTRVAINLFKPVTYKLAVRSFCMPAILSSYVIFFVESFLLPGVLRPPYPAKSKIAEAIWLLISVGFVVYVMLKNIYEAPKKNYNEQGYHALLLMYSYASLSFLGVGAFPKLYPIPLRWVLGIYFIYGVYITAGIHINHVSRDSNM